MGSEIVSRVTDILVNPQLSNSAISRAIQNAIDVSNYYSTRAESRLLLPILFLELFCISDYYQVFLPGKIASSSRTKT